MTTDPLLTPLIGALSKDLSRASVDKLFREEKSTQTEDAVDARLAAIVSEADSARLVQEFDKVTKVLGLRRRMNARRAVELAMALAAPTPEAERRPPEADWFAQWFEAVETVSDETIRDLWARAYANQTDGRRTPLSPRALDTLRLMDRQSVYAFHRISQACDALGAIFASDQDLLNAFLAPEELDALLDLSLLAVEETLSPHVHIPENLRLTITTPEGQTFADPFKTYRLTARARELAGTLPEDMEIDYNTPAAMDLDAPQLGPRYANLLARGFEGMPVTLTLTTMTAAVRGRTQASAGPLLRWRMDDAVWHAPDGLPDGLDPEAVDILTGGHIGAPWFDDA